MTERSPNGCAECGHARHLAGPCPAKDSQELPCGCAHGILLRNPRQRDDQARFYNLPGEDLPEDDGQG